MAYMKLFLVICMANCLLAAENEEKKKNDLADSDLQTDNTFGIGYYLRPHVSFYGRLGYPSYGGYYGGYGGYGYGYPSYGYGYPSYGYGYRRHGYYGGYPHYGGYYG
uniref:Secreted glycine-rich protein n=1 Tax=Pristhesancus plagipennis TaxID=1955184 RepID=A0A2K8JMC4_PRIPG|nr:secreted glycine-rich protein [Pristhesancus plagipennis]